MSAVEFPELVRRFRVTGVPKTIINESADILGAVPEAQFVETVVRGVGRGRPTAPLSMHGRVGTAGGPTFSAPGAR